MHSVGSHRVVFLCYQNTLSIQLEASSLEANEGI